MIEKGKENYLKKFFSLGLRSVNGVRYNRCKAKNVTFYYKNVAFFAFYNYYYFVVDFGYSREASVLRHVPDNIFYCKGVFNGNYTANPK